MKKSIFVAASLIAGLLANAQTEVVKDVERMLKGGNPDNAAALKAIQPALTNPETSGLYTPWYLAGKAGVGIYDQAFIKESMGQQTTKEEKQAAGRGLLDGVNYYKKSVELPDEKGKVPNKKAKEVINTLAGLYPQLRNAGIFLLQAGDYDGAYDVWEVYCNYPTDPIFAGKGPKADPDTIVGQIQFYQAVAMLSNNTNDKALEKLDQAAINGYNAIDVYRYGIEAGSRCDNKEAIYSFAQKGYEKYGAEDIIFIGQLINAKLENSDYAAARELAETAIAQTDESNAAMLCQLYDILGNVDDQEGNYAAALDNFNRSIEINPEYAKGYFDAGRIVYNTAIKADEASDGRKQSGDVTAELLQAADYFKKAYQLDSNFTQIPSILYRLYYRLGAGYEEDAKEWESMQ